MGVGKSTIGKLLAEKMNYGFIDMDEEIERREGKSISEIFRIKGESKFRVLESDLVKELSKREKTVIACGGGVIMDGMNAKLLSDSSKMVYLTASIDEIINRTSTNNNRPLLNVSNRVDITLELLEKRSPVYLSYADVTLDTTGKTPNEIVSELMEAIK